MPVRDRIADHERLRNSGLNLCVSENAPSRAVRQALASDLAGRYNEAFYGGSGPARALQAEVEDLGRDLFDAIDVLVTPTSGTICDLAVVLALTEAGGTVAMPPVAEGGFPLDLAKFERRRADLPMTDHLVPDADALAGFADDVQPDLVILGSSRILFPHPVEAARDAFDVPVVFDGAHVLGLIATDAYPDPLAEGADVLIGSTHKSLPGPQGGLVATDDADLARVLDEHLAYHEETGIGLIDNPHPSRIAALGVALEEVAGRPDYGDRVVDNSRALAAGLDDRGVPVRFADRGYTRTHQVLLDLAPEEASGYFDDLEDHLIFVDRAGRVGTAEATWRGMGPDEMRTVAQLMARVFDGDTKGVRKKAETLARKFPTPDGRPGAGR